MPHIELKVYPHYNKESLAALAGKLVKDVAEALDVPERVVSLAIEEVAPDEWNDRVFEPLIKDRECLVVQPDYQ